MALPCAETCPNCLAVTTVTEPPGQCATCGSLFPLMYLIEPGGTWDYSADRVAEMRKAGELRLMAAYKGRTPERLVELAHARKLYLTQYSGFSFAYLAPFEHLADFELDFTWVDSLEGIGPLPSLSIFSLTECRKIRDLSPLAGVPSIRLVSLALCSQLQDFTPLAALPKLEHIQIHGRSMTSLSFLPACKNLRSLALNVGKIEDGDFTPLLAMTSLRELFLSARGVKKAMRQAIHDAMPQCQVKIDSYIA